MSGTDQPKAIDDVLHFCFLVLFYAQAANNKLSPNQSLKLFLTFMPRTEFNTIYEQVIPKFQGATCSFFFDSHACYHTDKDGEVMSMIRLLLLAQLTAFKVDTTYCSRPITAPSIQPQFSAPCRIRTSLLNPPLC